MCSLKVATWVHEISGYRGVAAVQRWAGSRHSPLIPSEAQKATKSCFVCQQKRQTADGHVADCLGGRPCTELARETGAGSLGQLQMGPDRNRHWFWPGFCLLVVDEDAQSAIKGPALYQLGRLTTASSDQGTPFTDPRVRQWTETVSSEHWCDGELEQAIENTGC